MATTRARTGPCTCTPTFSSHINTPGHCLTAQRGGGYGALVGHHSPPSRPPVCALCFVGRPERHITRTTAVAPENTTSQNPPSPVGKGAFPSKLLKNALQPPAPQKTKRPKVQNKKEEAEENLKPALQQRTDLPKCLVFALQWLRDGTDEEMLVDEIRAMHLVVWDHVHTRNRRSIIVLCSEG